MMAAQTLINNLQKGDKKALSRCISLIENDNPITEKILSHLNINTKIPLIGITGSPGTGKSTIINSIIQLLLSNNKKIGIIAIDPTSPFNYGALLGDRLRLQEHFTHPDVFIRSLATRGSLGGLSDKTIEITDLMRSSDFDYIFIETVGIGQSEVEIAGLADTTVVILIPESGDEIQMMKSGIMEIGDIFVVNKADRPDADTFIKKLILSIPTQHSSLWQIPVIKTIATQQTGTEELVKKILQHTNGKNINTKKPYLLTKKALLLIQKQRMQDIDEQKLFKLISSNSKKDDFNLYTFVKNIEKDIKQ